MAVSWESFGTVVRQLLTPLMDRGIRDTQFTGYMCDRFSTGLSQSYRLTLKLDCVGLLNLVHDPFPLSGIVYSKLSLLHNFGGGSSLASPVSWAQRSAAGSPIMARLS